VKKLSLLILTLLMMAVISACGTDKAQENNSSADHSKTEETTASNTDSHDHSTDPIEPSADDVCVFCNMQVYGKDHEMGAFTAQALTADGENIFFDDSGCILNYSRLEDSAELEKVWVRDLNSKEWIEKDQSIVVKSDIMTPMKYGYSFFADQASADKFIEENKDKNAVASSWAEIDHVSHERFKKKMENMNSGSGMSHDHEEEGHEEEGHEESSNGHN
jgi:hypothetical protein